VEIKAANKEQEILLNREIINCSEVIVSYTHCPRIVAFGFYCKISGMNVTGRLDKKEPTAAGPIEFKTWPNPVQRGISLNLQFDNISEKENIVRVLNIDGKVVTATDPGNNPGKNISVSPLMHAGQQGSILCIVV